MSGGRRRIETVGRSHRRQPLISLPHHRGPGGELLAGLALGLAAAGAVTLLVGAVRFGEDLAPSGRGRGPVAALAVVVALGVVAVLLLRLARSGLAWVPALLATAAAGGSMAWGLAAFRHQSDLGFPGQTTLLPVAGGAAVVLGLAASLLLRPMQGALRRPAALSVCTLLLGAAAVPAAALGTAELAAARAESTATVAAPDEVADVPAAVGRAGWRRDLGAEVLGVTAAGPGAVAQLRGARLVALDGGTGAVRWRYSRPGAVISSVDATPDGDTVIARIHPGPSGRTALLGLDATTGERLFLREVGSDVSLRVAGTGDLLITDRAVVAALPGGDGPIAGLAGYSTEDGRRIWTWRPPDGCRVVSGIWAVATSGSAIVPATCPGGRARTDGVAVVAVRGRDGEDVWIRDLPLRRPLEVADVAASLVMRADRDGARLRVTVGDGRALDATISTTTGRRAAREAPAPTAGCPAGPATVVLAEGAVCAAIGAAGRIVVRAGPLPDGPLDRIPLGGAPSTEPRADVSLTPARGAVVLNAGEGAPGILVGLVDDEG
ncbi:MAG: PQQ-binding-like beta-propeller repeat protein [Thermoleophilia bacterium]